MCKKSIKHNLIFLKGRNPILSSEYLRVKNFRGQTFFFLNAYCVVMRIGPDLQGGIYLCSIDNFKVNWSKRSLFQNNIIPKEQTLKL